MENLKTDIPKKNSKMWLVTLTQASILGLAVIAQAKVAPMCRSDIAKTTTYFVPHIKDYCASSQPCRKFKREVRMQGSGALSDEKRLLYTGKTKTLKNCKTAIGASGNCLIPFVSVAADARYYSMGDIISMPSMKDKLIKLPDGTTFKHPGYFIVHDTGGAIKGSNRFDFFTGSYGMYNRDNAFGVRGEKETVMTAKNDCSERKKFAVVRRGSNQYETSLASIEEAVQGKARSERVMVASAASKEGAQ